MTAEAKSFNIFEHSKLSGNSFFLFVIIIALLYSSYRYPFQISSSGTSPGYADTPIELQFGKYFLLAVLGIWRLTSLLKNEPAALKFHRTAAVVVWASLFLAFYPTASLFFSDKIEKLIDGLLWLIFPIACLTTLRNRRDDGIVRASALNQLLKFFFLFNVIFLFVEVYLFIKYGRLPALSYEESFLVRFGGTWDDPNGYCIFLSFFFPFVFFSGSSLLKRTSAALVLVIMLALTQSVTGILCSFLGFYITAVILMFRGGGSSQYKTVVALPILVLLILLAVSINESFRDLVFDQLAFYIELKSGSAEGHAKSIDALLNSSSMALLGIGDAPPWGESGYVNWLLTFGFAYLAVFFVAAILIISKTVARIRAASEYYIRNIYTSILCFQITYLMGMVNLPLDSVFPVNILFIAFAALVFVGFKERKNLVIAGPVG